MKVIIKMVAIARCKKKQFLLKSLKLLTKYNKTNSVFYNAFKRTIKIFDIFSHGRQKIYFKID